MNYVSSRTPIYINDNQTICVQTIEQVFDKYCDDESPNDFNIRVLSLNGWESLKKIERRDVGMTGLFGIATNDKYIEVCEGHTFLNTIEQFDSNTNCFPPTKLVGDDIVKFPNSEYIPPTSSTIFQDVSLCDAARFYVCSKMLNLDFRLNIIGFYRKYMVPFVSVEISQQCSSPPKKSRTCPKVHRLEGLSGLGPYVYSITTSSGFFTGGIGHLLIPS